jgi:signal transduction histidine kinase
MKPRSFSFWLTAYLWLAGLVMAGVLGWGMWQSLRQLVEAAEADKVQALASQLAAVSVDAVLIRDYGAIERAVGDLVENRRLSYAQIRRQDGAILGQAGSHQPDNPTFTASMLAAGEPLGTVTAQYDNAPLLATAWRQAAWSAALLLLFALGVFLLLRHALSARLVSPVKSLIASAGPDGNIQPPAGNAPAEVQELSRALADLQARVQGHIAALEEASQAHNEALRKLCAEQRLASVGQMAGEVAHELNTPLANILGYAQMARKQPAGADLSGTLDVIAEQAKRAAQIVGDMLNVARAPAPSSQRIDLNALSQSFVRLVSPLARRQGVTLKVESAGAAIVWADPSRVEQILFNLVTNATQAGARHVTLRLDRGTLSIEDDGAGVPDDIRDRLFESFVTSKPAGQGTGLGLAICKRLAEEMDGRLELMESEPGHTVFQLALPEKS